LYTLNHHSFLGFYLKYTIKIGCCQVIFYNILYFSLISFLALAEDPLLFAEKKDFQILYCRLSSDRLGLTLERAVVNHLLQQHPYALFVFSDAKQENWHFVNVKEGAVEAEEPIRRRRRLFRRIAVGPYERLRTAAERIAMLDVAFISPSPLAIQQRHDEAFDVEAVTKAFFDDYRHLFANVQTQLQKQTNDAQWAHDYSLQLLNRLMFLYFIQRKRWLGNNPDFIRAFWEAYKSSEQPKDTFFSNWLSPLFFEAFNEKFQAGRADRRHFPPEIRDALARAPYLNGGLFTENELDDKYSFAVSDVVFEMLFDRFNWQTPGFLERYNFTIREDSPFDQEVAVDPEMIGKVYESLVNITTEGLKEEDLRGTAGIFYTPRIEIDLMCRLALVDWLSNHLGERHKPLLYEAVFAYEPDEKQDADSALSGNDLWKELNSLLREVTVLDPACGSGSFLVGMLTVLDDLQERANIQLGIEEDAYNRRKRIIGQSLYGVDVMPWAVHVAELRLWLQLIVENEIDAGQLRVNPLLPNLSFKVRPGDSLVQEVGSINLSLHRARLDIPTQLKGKLTQFKGEKLKFYNNASDARFRSEESLKNEELALFNDILFAKQHALENEIKRLTLKIVSPQAKQMVLLRDMEQEQAVQMELQAEELKRQREERQQELEQVQQTRDALRANQNVPFVWDIAFVEIFEGDKGGFDIVIGNPPYVDRIKIAPPMLSEDNFTSAKWKQLKDEYKATLQRSATAAYPHFFGFKPQSNTVTRKLSGMSDLYVYFYLHGLSLLNTKGSFCFITSNSWLDVGYGKDLQEFLLKHSHIKMILDNQAKRSFAQADVNTIIALLSPPDEKRQWGFDKTARFVTFKVPFEDILSPVIFQEIEEATERMSRPEFRVCALRQSELYEEGLATSDEEIRKRITTARYEGNKWGGKYLRAPDIFFAILEKGKGKLVQLNKIAHVRIGIMTGANEFFFLEPTGRHASRGYVHLRNSAGWESELEQDFVKPVLQSPREVRSLTIIRVVKAPALKRGDETTHKFFRVNP
jgi:type I restriction-modification system DNA methylase subunit